MQPTEIKSFDLLLLEFELISLELLPVSEFDIGRGFEEEDDEDVVVDEDVVEDEDVEVVVGEDVVEDEDVEVVVVEDVVVEEVEVKLEIEADFFDVFFVLDKLGE